MPITVSIKEYDKLHIRKNRDLERHIISETDAAYLQTAIIDNSPVFSYGNRCLIAQHWVGVIELPEYTIEILPKLYGEVSEDDLRNVLIRMLLVAHQTSAIRKFQASVSIRKNSLIEMLIESFLKELLIYVSNGLQHEYKKIERNIDKIKGRIVFGKQLKANVTAPTRFYCRYSSYVENNELNIFFKTCLDEMNRVSRDYQNIKMIKEILPFFSDISSVDTERAQSFIIRFSSVNIRAKDAYTYGKMFLDSIHATMNSGAAQMYTMLFDMNNLYELFIYRVMNIVFGHRVTYQKMGSYMLKRNEDGHRYINLRPDLTYKTDNGELWIIDTKWKIPTGFVRESDVYQMNAYSTAIENVSKVILLYPKVSRTDHIVGYYTLLSAMDVPRPLEIKTINLMNCLDWKGFLADIKSMFIAA